MIEWRRADKMTYQVEYDPKSKIVVTRVAGELTTAGVKRILRKQVKLSRAHCCGSFLSDYTESTLITCAVDIRSSAADHKGAGLVNSHPRALVVRNQLGDYDCIETVMRKEGWNMKVFTDTDEAFLWLGKN